MGGGEEGRMICEELWSVNAFVRQVLPVSRVPAADRNLLFVLDTFRGVFEGIRAVLVQARTKVAYSVIRCIVSQVGLYSWEKTVNPRNSQTEKRQNSGGSANASLKLSPTARSHRWPPASNTTSRSLI